MRNLEQLEAKVKALYASNEPDRADWASWLIDNHVLVVADYATGLALKHGADLVLSRAAALLHDIADVRMKRNNKDHVEESLRIARGLMSDFGFSEEDITIVVDDAIRFHSCHDQERPSSLEGKILSTSDSLAHLKTDFYIFATWALGRENSLEEVKSWTLKKLERDLNTKIFFDDVREDVRPDYETIKKLFSR